MASSKATVKTKGKCFVFGDNINTDEIIPARYLSSSDPAELASWCMEDSRPGFGRRDDLRGAIIVAGENFGCGSSREHAPIAIKASGISCVVAKSFARIFLRNAFNIGLPIVELPEAGEFSEGDQTQLDLEAGIVQNLSTGKNYRFGSYPEFLRQVIAHGGWLAYAAAELTEEQV
ncbi:MAG: 3-isopropylmalate dehydratase small subunit [Spirochaetia bacterium]|nr:3-isopropylmalate dehydratase small subunit [Spirochaetia bacterium]